MAGTQFVGRRGELDHLGRVLRGDSDAASVAVVTGDAGIGKTRLVAEVIKATPDVLVLAGACLPLSESLPYGAVTEALSALVGTSGGPALHEALSRCAPYVRPQISVLIPALSEEARTSRGGADDRTRLFTAARDLLAALGADRRTALVVEDLHWADPGTLDLLTFLVRGLPAGTALVATSRRDELPVDSPVLDWIATTARLPGTDSVTLGQLQHGDVASLVASLVDEAATPGFVTDVIRRSEGNPFFTEQLVAAARDVAPPLEVPAGVPPGVAQMLLGRVRSVGVNAAEVSAALAVAARPLAETELVVCVGSGVHIPSALRELLDAHLVETAELDRYRLRHALLEDTVRITLLPSHRAKLHAGVADVLAARRDVYPAEVAVHWRRAGDLTEEARWSVRAAIRAERLFAWREASASWRRVWMLWEALPSDQRPEIEFTQAVVRCVVDAGRTEEHPVVVRLIEDALADDRVLADDQAAGQLMRLYGDRQVVTNVEAGLGTLKRSLLLFDRAGQASAEQARAIQRFVHAKVRQGATTGNEDAEFARAEAIAQQLDDRNLLLELASERGSNSLRAGNVEGGLSELTSVLHEATATGADDVALETSNRLTDAYLWLLRLDEGLEAGRLAIARALATGHGETFSFAILVANTVDCALLRGELDAANALVARHLTPDVTYAGWPLHLAGAELNLLDGKMASALAVVERVEQLGDLSNEELTMWLAEVTAAGNLWLGQSHVAWVKTEQALTRVQHTPLAWRGGRLLTLAAQAGAEGADLEPGADRHALAGRLRVWAEKAACFVAHPARVLDAAYGVTFNAELARLERSGEKSAWRAAKETWAGHGVPHHAAYAGWRLAEKLLDEGRRNEAETELVVAYAAALNHGPIRREIEGLAHRARLPLPPAVPTEPSPEEATATSDTSHGLTPRELDVLRLLATGATNAEIGRRLYMSPKTASVHVSAIIRKLGVTGRVQAATVAERMGLLTGDSEGSQRH